MKFSVQRPAFLSELALVTRAAATRSAIPALGGVMLRGSDGNLELAATDTEIALRSSMPAEIEQEGALLLPARLLLDIVRVADGDTVTIEAASDQGVVKVTSQRASFSLRTLQADDFPKLPADESDAAVRLDAAALAATIDRVAKAASRDETRPVLTGILVSLEGATLRMVATDSYRLSVKESAVPSANGSAFEANVPARALQELGRVIAETQPETVAIVTKDNQVVFESGRVTLSSRLIDGQFPNYRQLLPESYEHDLVIDKGELLGVVRRVSLMAQRNAPLRLRFDEGALTLSAQTPDVGEASESVPVNYQGEQLEIGFNPQFLQDGLESVGASEVRLKLINPLRPGLIEGAGAEEDDQFLYLIMPVRLNV
jgi:DNA polymerase III subunit beta